MKGSSQSQPVIAGGAEPGAEMGQLDVQTAARALASWADGGHPGPYSVAECARIVLADREALVGERDEAIRDRNSHAEHVLRIAQEAEAGFAALEEADRFWEACGYPGNRKALTTSEQVSSIIRERDAAEARATQAKANAQAWHGLAQTICTVLDLGELDFEQIAEAVRSKFGAAEAREAELREALRNIRDNSNGWQRDAAHDALQKDPSHD